MDTILDKLSKSIFVHINPTSLSVMNVALDHRRIRAGLHLETGNTIVVYVVFLKVSLFIAHTHRTKTHNIINRS